LRSHCPKKRRLWADRRDMGPIMRPSCGGKVKRFEPGDRGRP
jgi:hypothetical protein